MYDAAYIISRSALVGLEREYPVVGVRNQVSKNRGLGFNARISPLVMVV